MEQLEKRCLADCISGYSSAKAGIRRLLGLPLSEYFDGYEEEFKSLSQICKKRGSGEIVYFPDLFYIVQLLDTDEIPEEIIHLIVAPFQKSEMGLKEFSFSFGAFLDVLDDYCPCGEYEEARDSLRKSWKVLMDYSMNRIIKKFMEEKNAPRLITLCFYMLEFLEEYSSSIMGKIDKSASQKYNETKA